jgi:ubiquinone/menaquinone biosynthesis C-methylase UbiE
MSPMTTAIEKQKPSPAPGHDWREAGQAWGHAANEWATLYEHYAMDILLAVFPRIGVGPDVDLLDIACGSGLGSRLASAAGANVSGVDAAESLVGIARDRCPESDIRLGSMFELPWADESFDAAMSINGIWGGCEGALQEAFRVLRPGGPIGISFWGRGRPLHLRDAFTVFAAHSPTAAVGGMVQTNNIATDGVAETMLESCGFEVLERGTRISTVEWPDADTAWRALRSVGPSVPALRCNDEATLKAAVLEAIDHCRDERGIYRFLNDHHFVIARKM